MMCKRFSLINLITKNNKISGLVDPIQVGFYCIIELDKFLGKIMRHCSPGSMLNQPPACLATFGCSTLPLAARRGSHFQVKRTAIPLWRYEIMPHNLFNTLQSFDLGNGQTGQFYS